MRNVRVKPETGEIYHVYNRGVDKRTIFMDDFDNFRFIHDLFEFNDKFPAGKFSGQRSIRSLGITIGSPTSDSSSEVGLPIVLGKRDCIVDILAYCLMSNHYHLMLRQKTASGITEFIRKLNTGYTNYFNKKYERAGSLFQGKYKLIHIKEDVYFKHLPYYIHLNPLDLVMPEWRDGTLKNSAQAMRFLEGYRWSSFPDYIGIKNFPSVINRQILDEILDTPQEHKQNIVEWIQKNGIEEIEHLALE